MLTGSESGVFAIIALAAFSILAWGFTRSRRFGRVGLLAWLQTVVLMAPWLLFFGLFAFGVVINLAGILLLLLVSVALYIYLGTRLRQAAANMKGEKTSPLTLESSTRSEKEDATKDQSSPETTVTAEEPVLARIDPEELGTVRSIFSVDTFFATETIPYEEGAIFRGNLRGEPEKVHTQLSRRLTEKVGDKYRLFLVENAEQKPVVVLLPSSRDPRTTTLAQKNLAVVLFIALVATCCETGGLLLGFDWFSNLGRFAEVLPLVSGLIAVLVTHEIAHWVVAQRHNVKLSIPFFLPSWQIGAFGAITRFESLLRNRTTLFDISFAGPAAGGALSLFFLVVGLSLSQPDSGFRIPSEFLQSSILVGSLARVVLGSDVVQQVLVEVNLLTVVGWLGLVITALNLLPAGQLDGGRIVQAVYGRQTARRTTIATLIVLAIVTLLNPANPIPLYWAAIILFLQRELERPSLNELTEPSDTRAAWGLLLLFLMLATLVPLSPSLAGRLGIGG
ncbi:MAG: site-2 protease family protein [Cyanobacteria bacterium P01_H01_bin.15]